MEISDESVIEYNEKVLVPVKAKEPLYSIIARPRNYNVRPGDMVEIDIYITGLGIPDNHKLFVVFSSPNVIDSNSMGTVTSCIQLSLKKLKGKDTVFPVAGREYMEEHQLDPNGITIHLPNAYFLPWPNPRVSMQSEEKTLMTEIMAEKQFDGCDPISLSFRTLKAAKSGSYEIYFALTYEYQNVMKQASHKTEFHITSWWDRHQAKVFIVSAVVSFVLIVLTYISTLQIGDLPP